MILENEIALGGTPPPVGYQIERSLRFNIADGATLSRTFTSGGSRTTWTYSAWIKRSSLIVSDNHGIFATMPAPQQNRLHFTTSDKILFLAYNGGGFVFQLQTTQSFRDLGAWYHLVAVVDSTNATASERIRLYVNGTRITALDVATYPSQNADCLFNGPTLHEIGGWTSSSYFAGYQTELNFIDGQALDPSSFGETSTSTGVWTPKAYTGTYGITGFYLPFNDNSTALNLGRNRQPLTADPYWPYTTLLLNGNGTNGAQNNTFLDSSSNNFSITRNGNVSQGTFSPFSPAGWGVNFSGAQTSPSLSFPSNAAYSIGGTADFTVEMFVYFTGGIGSEVSLMERFDGTSGPGWIVGKSNTDKFWFGFAGSTYAGNTSVVANRWYHLCWMRTGGNSYLFLDGVLDRAVVTTANFTDGTSPLSLGERDSGSQTFPFTGYMSNARIVKGTAVYSTSGFTVPTSALTAVTNTTFLGCQSNRFADNSVTAATATVGAASSIQPFSPFLPTAAYSAATHGGSAYFDGSGDYLVTPSNAAVSSTLLSGDFTIESWLYLTAYPSGGAPIWTTSTANSDGFSSAYVTSTGTVAIGKVGVNEVVSTATVVRNAWNHFATVRSGATVYLYLNGVQIASGAASTYLNTSSAKPLQIAQSNQSAAANLTGYISGFRAVSSALYTGASYTPPTIPPTAISGTQLLLNFTNAGIIDATGKNVLETVGNAQISTTQSKWGGSSIYFDGTGDYLPIRNNNLLQFGTGDFTFEAWIYPTNLQASKAAGEACVIDTGSSGFLISLWNNNVHLASYGVADLADFSSTGIANNTWAHLVITRSGTSVRCFVNGTQAGSTATLSTNFSSSGSTYIGAFNNATSYYTGYIDDLRISKFCRYTGNFTPPAAQFAYNQADINVNQWVPNNLSITAGVGNDSLVDTPTNYGTDTGAGGEVRGNYCTLNPLDRGSDWTAVTNGNLDGTVQGPNGHSIRSTMAVSSGKWYWEFTNVNNLSCGIIKSELKIVPSTGSLWVGSDGFGAGGSFGYRPDNGNKTTNSTGTAYGATFTTTDVIGCALDMDNGKIYWSKNGVWQASGDPAAGTNAAFTGISGTFSPAWGYINAGAGTLTCNFGQRPFAYTAPSGFKALCSTNLPTPAIGASATTLASKNFDVALWTGDGNATKAISGLAFQPDVIWNKSRSAAYSHCVYDAVRGFGITKAMSTNQTTAEGAFNDNSTSGYVNSVTADGYVMTKGSTGEYTNQSGITYSGWTFKAGGTAVTNTAGSISSQVSANPAAGISVVGYTGTGAAGTIGHGLGVAPKMVIAKRRDNVSDWAVYHNKLPDASYFLYLNSTAGQAVFSGFWNNTAPTSSVVNIGSTFSASGGTYIAYCFAEVPGFSKFGSYTGNGSTDGPFVYCGFRPKFILVKNTDTGTEVWGILDSARDTYNVANKRLYPNASNAENTGDATVVDFLSNGFKLRSTDALTNASRAYIFAAFAEAPFNYARAR